MFNTCALFAQINISYSIGGIGGNMKTSTYSNPLLISGANCFNISNSISKFKSSNKGDFLTNCVVKMDYVNFRVDIYPNPVTNFAFIKFVSKVQDETQFRITVFSNVGQPLIGKDIPQDQLLLGYKLQMSNLPTGYYYIQIASPSILRTFKILKN